MITLPKGWGVGATHKRHPFSLEVEKMADEIKRPTDFSNRCAQLTKDGVAPIPCGRWVALGTLGCCVRCKGTEYDGRQMIATLGCARGWSPKPDKPECTQMRGCLRCTTNQRQ